MKLEKQAVSLELATKLKELGVKQDSLFWWDDHSEVGMGAIVSYSDPDNPICSAYTVAELGELMKDCNWDLPYTESNWSVWECRVDNDEFGEKQYIQATTEADARAKMLIYLIENKLIKC